jgi:hypothetical protein
MKLDPKTGRILPTKIGEKTEKMLEVERQIGRTLEEDFQDYYVTRGYGQKRLAQRWGVHRQNIFGTSTRDGRRSWVVMLKLDVRRHADAAPAGDADQKSCECCGESGVTLDQAHWIADTLGGPAHKWNLLDLCPNCHRKLDRHDERVEERCKRILLFRVCKTVIEGGGDREKQLTQLLKRATAVILRKTPEEESARLGATDNPGYAQ